MSSKYKNSTYGGYMKKSVGKLNVKKIFLISAGVLLALILTVISIGFIIMRHYIRKMNLVDSDVAQGNYAYADDYNGFLSSDTAYADEDEILRANSGTENMSTDNSADESSGQISTDDAYILQDYTTVKDLPVMEDKDVFNILLIGSDSRDLNDLGRSDAMMILSVNKKTKNIILTSLLRDIYLNIPGKKSNRLNTAYAIGGAKLLTETIEENFKIKLDGYVSVDFFAFLEIIDAIGGVTVEITEEELPFLNSHIRDINKILKEDANKDVLALPGKHLLNGKQTLGYSRIRYVGTDFERTARQRKVIEQIFEKMKKAGIKNIVKLLDIVLPKVTTNLKEIEIISHILNLPDYLGYEFKQWRIPVNGSYRNAKVRGMDVLLIDFEKNIKEISERIYMKE